MESADRESRRLDILSVKKEANMSAREGHILSLQVFNFAILLDSQNSRKLSARENLVFYSICMYAYHY